MKYSIGVEYALHCMIYMVKEKKGKHFTVKELAKFQGISETYLSKIYTKLVKAELIQSVPGTKGGYVLNRPASEISFWDIIEAVEGNEQIFQCAEIRKQNILSDHEKLPSNVVESPCFIKLVMTEAENQMKKYLQEKNLGWLQNEVYENVLDKETVAKTQQWFEEN